MTFQVRQCQTIQIANRRNADRFHTALGDLTDPRNAAYRKRKKKILYFVGLNDKEAVWLAPVGRNLCKELVWCDTRRSGQIQFLADLLTDGLRDTSRSGQTSFVLGYVQVGFIERQRFNEISMQVED